MRTSAGCRAWAKNGESCEERSPRQVGKLADFAHFFSPKEGGDEAVTNGDARPAPRLRSKSEAGSGLRSKSEAGILSTEVGIPTSLSWPVIKDMLFMPFCLVLCLDRKPCFFARAFFVKTIRFSEVFFPKILGREGGLDVWTIRWLRELFLLCQLVVKLGARAAMDIYGAHADELAHCVALHVIEMKIDEIIVRNCSMERTGRRAAMFPFAVVLAGMERALISPLPSDDLLCGICALRTNATSTRHC